MNVIQALTLRHLKLNKKRTLTTLIGVILSVSMITAVPTFVTSFLDMMQRSVMEETGVWHVIYKDISTQAVDVVKNDENTKQTILNQDIGYAVLKGSKNENKPYLFITSYDDQGFTNFNVKLIEGRLPQNDHEVVISAYIGENGGVQYKIGDVLHLEIGNRILKENDQETVLEQDYNLQEAGEDQTGESLVLTTARDYTITGIIERPGFEPYWAPGYTVISYLDKDELSPADKVNIAVVWKNISKPANNHANALADSLGVTPMNVDYNQDLLRYYGIINDGMLGTLLTLAAIITTLIIIGSVALIYNAFSISIVERSRHLGMLASVGATKQQKRSSVFYEAFIIGAIGIPIGVLCGTLGMGITFALVQPLVASFTGTNTELRLATSPLTILIAVVVSAITIFISAYIPARRASRISPIDAIRQSQDIKLTHKVVKTSRLTRRIFGIEAELGLKNLKRNHRSYRTTIFSMVISIVLFLTVSSLALLAQGSAQSITDNVPYDVEVFVTSSATAQEKRDFYTAVSHLDHVDQSVISQDLIAAGMIGKDRVPENIRAILDENGILPETEGYRTYFQIEAIDDDSLARFARENGIDVAMLKDTANPCGILINTVITQLDDRYQFSKLLNVKTGETLPLTLSSPEDAVQQDVTLKIAALADKMPLGNTEPFKPMQATIIISEDVFASLSGIMAQGYYLSDVFQFIKSADPTQLVESIHEYQKGTSIGNVQIDDIAASQKRERQIKTFVLVFTYGFVALITAIGVANIFNTIFTSIALRKREFAMLRSVGMTPRDFLKMVNYESIFYGIKALIYGLPISFALMYLLYWVTSDSFMVKFIFPWNSVLLVVIGVFAIVSSCMLYASSKVRHENIIDALKMESY
ncbi:ABC-type transport system [Longilinea arvoryzae]|uniref:ABC-type transport system n=1 Tax=Longilinea arvoryzae TaxID=360412 RepID=A0A0S7BL81_9CHLR|nr:ABC transporter permease [Longilinea arvoryzae]GAP15395.1 ABC-type transport system [Longilinea arvoryzae]